MLKARVHSLKEGLDSLKPMKSAGRKVGVVSCELVEAKSDMKHVGQFLSKRS